MKFKLPQIFLCSSGLLLLTTSIAKLITVGGHAMILYEHDPILRVPFRWMLLMVGVGELVVALICLLGKGPALRATLVAWMSTNFCIYRASLTLSGYHKPCGCLGNMTDALHISSQTADTAMKIILAYLLLGSYATLFWLWRQRKKAIPAFMPTQ